MTMLVTDAALAEFLAGSINWTSDTFRLYLVDSTPFTPGSNPHVSDLPGSIAHGTVPSKGIVANQATCGVTTCTSVPSSVTVAGIWLARWTGTSSTSRLIGFTDSNADSTPIAYTTTGANVSVEFSPYIFSI